MKPPEHIEQRKKKWLEENKERKKRVDRAYHLKRYSLTPEEFDRLVLQSAGKCPICGVTFGTNGLKGDGAVVDHDHATGKVRGIICNACNRGIGQFSEDTDVMLNAVKWLQNAKSR
jgi:hypothetical protein